MKLIDRFISRELLVNVLFAIAVLSLVLVVGNIFRKLLPLLVNHDVPMEYLITFIAYVLPFSLIFTIPWGLLTAILLVFMGVMIPLGYAVFKRIERRCKVLGTLGLH